MKSECLNACMKKMTFEEAKALLSDYEYVLAYEISRTVLAETCSNSDIDWNVCREAYFFDKKGQVHIYEDEEAGDMKAVVFTPGDMDYVERTEKPLAGIFAKATGKKSVIVREYMDADEDGQMCVVYTALYDLK